MDGVSVGLAALVGFGLLIVFVAITEPRHRNHLSTRVSVGEEDTSFKKYVTRPAAGGAGASITAALGYVNQRIAGTRAMAKRSQSLNARLDQTSLRIKAVEWVLIVGGTSLVVGAVVALRFNLALGGVATVLSALIGGPKLLNFLIARRTNRLKGQLAGALGQMANAMRVGQSLNQALRGYVAAGKAPLAEEFKRALREMELGVSTEAALRHMADRCESEDLSLAVSAVAISRASGGSLAEIFDTLAVTIRERVQVAGEIKVLTAQARMSGWVIGLLPVFLAVILELIAPDYFGPMLRHAIGFILLGVSLFSLSCGVMIIRRIVRIDI